MSFLEITYRNTLKGSIFLRDNSSRIIVETKANPDIFPFGVFLLTKSSIRLVAIFEFNKNEVYKNSIYHKINTFQKLSSNTRDSILGTVVIPCYIKNRFKLEALEEDAIWLKQDVKIDLKATYTIINEPLASCISNNLDSNIKYQDSNINYKKNSLDLNQNKLNPLKKNTDSYTYTTLLNILKLCPEYTNRIEKQTKSSVFQAYNLNKDSLNRICKYGNDSISREIATFILLFKNNIERYNHMCLGLTTNKTNSSVVSVNIGIPSTEKEVNIEGVKNFSYTKPKYGGNIGYWVCSYKVNESSLS